MKDFDSKCTGGYANYLKGMYFGILQDFDKGKNFDKLLDSILIELLGLLDEKDSISLYKLYAKTSSLKYLKKKYFRETILYNCMPLIDSIFRGE